MTNDEWHFRKTSSELWGKLKDLARENRHEPTSAEDALWQQLRGRKIQEAKFRRQHTIERFIVDFYCAEARLIIEVDGSIHDYTPVEDAIRQEFLESQEYRVIRFTNGEVLKNMPDVLKKVAAALSKTTSP